MSRAAFDVLAREHERALATIEMLTEQITRLVRHGAGLPEVRREQAPQPVPIPPQIREWIDAWESPHIRQELERRARLALKQGAPPEAVLAALKLEAEE